MATSVDLSETRQPSLYASSTIPFVFAVACVGSRFWCRWTNKAGFWLDDWLILFALICAIGLTADMLWWIPRGLGKHVLVFGPNVAELFNIGLFTAEMTYTGVIIFVKFSIAALYQRIFRTENIKLPIIILSVLVAMWGIAVFNTNIVAVSPYYLLPAYVPPNVRTICDNVEYPWEVKGEIDFVHCRAMAGAIKDWRLLVHNIHGWLRQGGWVEFHEFGTTFYASDGSELDSCHPFVELMNAVLGVCDVIGQTLDPARYLPQWLSDAGFTQIEKISVKIDMIARDQYVGKGCDNFDLFLTRILPLTHLLSNKLSWSTARVDNLRRRVERAIATDNVKMDYLIFRGAKDG